MCSSVIGALLARVIAGSGVVVASVQLMPQQCLNRGKRCAHACGCWNHMRARNLNNPCLFSALHSFRYVVLVCLASNSASRQPL
jgi:hypothetical protein